MSEVARLRKQIELECEAMRLANLFASVPRSVDY